MAKGHRVGYVRVSTIDQNTDRQLEGIKLDKVFLDKASGKDSYREQLEAMVDYVRSGDTVVVHSMDRLARNLDDLRNIVQTLTAKGVRIEFVKESLTFVGDDSPMAVLLLSVMGAFAEFERSLIKERQREGIALAKQKGIYKGRRPALSPPQIDELRRRVESGEAKTAVARSLGISRETLYKYVRELDVA
ncbi:recombinase family protein [Ferrimicrobium sp.]|uniref:recombinase family protein n=1 Tax=Ferrimicrobium sp. TaxID=2926050 RepID=UPI002635D28F|nr:recombinase family protein [Ferrimicrobium sp.]